MSVSSATITELCKKYSHFDSDDIDLIHNISDILPLMADVTQADIFIDCITDDPNIAIVISEAKPKTAKSLYRFSVVGQLALRENEPAVIRTQQTGLPTLGMRGMSQEGVPIKQSVVPIKNKNNKTIGSLIMEQDISQLVSQEKRIRDLSATTEQLSDTLIKMVFSDGNISDVFSDGLLIINDKGEIIFYNITSYHMLERMGYKNIEIKGEKIYKIFPELNMRVDIKEEKLYMELQKNYFSFALSFMPLIKNNSAAGALILLKDITEIREKEKELILQSVAIREMHHRIKNNLQTIASLLRLQERRVDSIQAKKALEESINRILTIAVVHEELSKIGSEKVRIKEIINRFVDMIKKSMLDDCNQITINVECDDVYLISNHATSLALIINELLLNAVQHAFREVKKGVINVSLKNKNGFIRLIVHDSGIGIGSEFDINKTKSLGMKVVQALAEEDLKGTISIDGCNGTTITITFPFQE